MYRKIPIKRKGEVLHALVDADIYEKLVKYTWQITPDGYAIHMYRVNGMSQNILMHRLITSAPNNLLVDHRNRARLDNRRKNLRLCTPSENVCNSRLRSDNKSGLRGVYYAPHRKKWLANVTKNGVRYNLGGFDTPEQANEVRTRKAKELYGDFFFQEARELAIIN